MSKCTSDQPVIRGPVDPVDWHFEKRVLKLGAKLQKLEQDYRLACEILRDYRAERAKRK